MLYDWKYLRELEGRRKWMKKKIFFNEPTVNYDTKTILKLNLKVDLKAIYLLETNAPL